MKKIITYAHELHGKRRIYAAAIKASLIAPKPPKITINKIFILLHYLSQNTVDICHMLCFSQEKPQNCLARCNILAV